ncbi:hypothetical protein [Photobacterium marinum]|uniref:hypothetical protein n=1 Tax=Photobacterium marinum TaxID=1056511 RepID=UPI00056783D7|nr:hypothetical protein [Photobacterium marinum]
MLKFLKRNLKDQNNNSEDMSLDFGLMFVYHIAMMILFALRPISNPIHQVYLALVLLVVLVLISSFHKLKCNWSWPGLAFSNVSSLIVNLISTYIFFAFVSYTITSAGDFYEISLENIDVLIIESWNVILQAASNPVFTPWFLAGAGIGFMNSLVSLKIVTLKKSEFEAQCRNS